MIIPTNIWEETKDSDKYVFSKIPLSQYVNSMKKLMTDIPACNIIISKTNAYTSSIISHGKIYEIKVYLIICNN